MNSRFANYLFRSNVMVDQYLINSKSVGSIQRNIYWPSLKRTVVPVPPRDEQDQIVRFLDWKVSLINKLINIKRKEIKLIEEHLRCVIHTAVTKGLDTNKPMKDSGVTWLGAIPNDWSAIKIKWLFNEDNKRNTQGQAELLAFSRKKGLIPFSDVSNKQPSAADLTNYRLVEAGQLLENRMQAWNGMFICVTRNGCVSPDYSVFNPSADRYVNVKFYEYVFRNPLQVEQFANASRGLGTGFNRLYTPAFGAIYTVYPPKEDQDTIVEYLDSVKKKHTEVIEKIEIEIQNLIELKSRLISDVVTGKIDVRDVVIPDYEYVDEEIDTAETDDSEENIEEQEDE